jgi:hypothetical protein
MALKRDSLRQMFRNGARPAEKDFKAFIESSIIFGDDGINLIDDGRKNGLKLTKSAASDDKKGETYQIQFGDDQIHTLQFSHAGDTGSAAVISLGINQQGISTNNVTVNGKAVIQARQGSFTQANADPPLQPKKGEVKPSPLACDGTWQTILYTKKICQAYEVVAQLTGDNQAMFVACVSTSQSPVTDKNTDKQSVFSKITEAVGNFIKKLFNISSTKIKITQSYSDWLSDRIRMRWVENYNSYSLQVMASSGDVYYSITQLWGNNYVNQND